MRTLVLCCLLIVVQRIPAANLPCAVGPIAIRAYSVVSNSTAITLNWPTNDLRTEIRIARRVYTNSPSAWAVWADTWTNVNPTTVVQAGNYNDATVSVGVHYEYRVAALVTNWTCGDHTNTWAFEYINAGINVPLKDTRGNLILLVENGLTNSLASELSTLTNDLTGEGYKIFRHNIAATEVYAAGWFTAVTNTKALCMADYATSPSNEWTIFIVGHVPIPYSGLSSPGSHTENFGAHPADWFYADTNAAAWTDSTANDVTASGADPYFSTNSWNVPGDGKFDQSFVPSIPEMSVGRVDLRNMPAFGNTEVQRLQQYFARNHQWRHKQFTVRDRSLVITSGLPFEVHSLYSSFFGTATNVDLNNWLGTSTNTASSYLFAAAKGAGGFDHDLQIGVDQFSGYTTNVAASPLYIAFPTMFGSYYGDWDSAVHTNVVLLAPMSDSGYALTTEYRENIIVMDSSSGNEPIGMEMLATAANFYPSFDNRYIQSAYLFGGSRFDTTEQANNYCSLQGDPTLRVKVVAPPTNTTIMIDTPDKMISWGASSDTGIVGYHIYRAYSTNLNAFTRLTSVPTNSPYRDTNVSGVAYNYMVRAIKLDGGTNRSFYNASQGAFQSAIHGTNYYVATTGNNSNPGTLASPFLTIQKGVDTALAGDTIYVAAGRYQENVRTDTHTGAAGSPIIIDGQNVASVGSFSFEFPYLQLQNFTITDGTNLWNGFLYVHQPAHYCISSNNIFDAKTNQAISPLVRWNGPDAAPYGQAGSGCLFVSNRFLNAAAEMVFRIYGDTNTFVGNRFYDSDTTDFMQCFGRTNYVIGNTVSNIYDSGLHANHTDFFQTFGISFGSKGHIIESNYVIAGHGLMQIGNMTDGDLVSDITFRNNQFIGVSAKISCAILDAKFYNNTFIRCGTNTDNGGHIINFTSAFFGNGGRVYNNVFLDCGTGSTNDGWYFFDVAMTNISADYNYVGKNGTYKAVKFNAGHHPVGDPSYDGDWWENHGINGGNPSFVNESALNYRLLTNAILVDAGTNLTGIVAVDYDGISRPQGATWDIGAFEYQSGATNGGGGGGGPTSFTASSRGMRGIKTKP